MKSVINGGEPLNKNFTQPTSFTTGLQTYDLPRRLKTSLSGIDPVAYCIPVYGGRKFIDQTGKPLPTSTSAITRAGVSEGKRGGVINQKSLNETPNLRHRSEKGTF